MTPDASRDAALIQIVDRAVADSVARSGPWLACRPGCAQCCHGVFPISPLDADRLRAGLVTLATHDPGQAARIRDRVAASLARLTPDFPGNPETGHLDDTPDAEAAFDDFANAEPCPVLDPLTQTCDLYTHRPVLCRTFGPPLQTAEGGLAICDLCFDGAAPEEIAAAEIDPAINAAEAASLAAQALADSATYTTLIAFALKGL